MALVCHDTLTRALRPLPAPAPGGPPFGVYTCGPTVYDRVHVGNLRTFCAYDLLVRVLRRRFGPSRVKWVMNVTDVDDRTLQKARAEGAPLRGVTDRFHDAFLRDLDALALRRPDAMPRATDPDEIAAMIALVRELEARGHTYAAEGSVYFRLASFPAYGRLSHLDAAGLKAGARVAQDDYTKEEARDFVLWKGWVPEDGDTGWDTPWGRGRPGWHLECSAMSRRHLGTTVDLHAGGIDLVFPHHENEIAQSEAATGQPFVRHWLHTAFVNMGDAKMSKRLGNVRTLDAIAALGLAPADFRAWGLSTHYRQPTVFLPETLEAAAQVRRDFTALRRRLRDASGAGTGPLATAARDAIAAMDVALDDDLNVSAALAALHGLKTAANRALDQGACAKRDAEAVEAALNEADSVFGWLAAEGEAPLTERQQQLLDARREARARKDWMRADEIRALLAGAGLAVEDTPAGQRWRRG